MKILINASNIHVGGGLQVVLSFINELNCIDASNSYHLFISRPVEKQINYSIFSDNFKFYLIPVSPSSLISRLKTIKLLSNLERGISPDVVFTVFGPSYWTSRAPHVMGFANGWLYNPKSIAYAKLRLIDRIRMRMFCLYQEYYLKRDADFFIMETHDAKNKISKVLSINTNKIAVVGNTHSSVFNKDKFLKKNNKHYIALPQKRKCEYRLVYITHNHPSKNLKVINDVCKLLKIYDISFVLTIDHESYAKIFSNNANVINIGPVSHKSCPSIYSQCDFLFAPTLLETFSASYPEAMKMSLPILTSDYSFARSVCHDSAIYFDPTSPKDIAKKIDLLIRDQDLQKKKCKKWEACTL